MIDAQTQDDLRKRFNPDGSPLRFQQLRMLEMLAYFDDVCRRHGIRYWLSSGTLIGAVRHGGFIPWDDDVDVEMLRDDYEKLITIFENEPNPKFILQTHRTDFYYFQPFAKLRDPNSLIKETGTDVDRLYKYQGIFIDVFVLDPSSSRRVAYVAHILHNTLILNRISKIKSPTLRLVYYKTVYGALHKLLFPTIRFFMKAGTKDRLRHALGGGFFGERFYHELFPLKTVLFENLTLPVPHHYDCLLKRIYGNYMTLPPLNTIECHITELELK